MKMWTSFTFVEAPFAMTDDQYLSTARLGGSILGVDVANMSISADVSVGVTEHLPLGR